MTSEVELIFSVFLTCTRVVTAIFAGLGIGLVWCELIINDATLWTDWGNDDAGANWQTTRVFTIITVIICGFQMILMLKDIVRHRTFLHADSSAAHCVMDLLIWVCACVAWGVTKNNGDAIPTSAIFSYSDLCTNGPGYQFMQATFGLALVSFVCGVLFVDPGFLLRFFEDNDKPAEAEEANGEKGGDVENPARPPREEGDGK